jgi:outer membrane murein-binding lipoprotein Lpp
MKKVLFTIGIIAILAWVAVASMAAASNPSAPWTSIEQKIDALSTKVTNLQGNVSAIRSDLADVKSNVTAIQTDLAGVPVMWTNSGYMIAQNLGEWATSVDRNYFGQVRHVSLTIDLRQYPFNMPALGTRTVKVEAYVGNPTDPFVTYPTTLWEGVPDTEGDHVTLDFNTDHWMIKVFDDTQNAPFYFRYTDTVTYVP